MRSVDDHELGVGPITLELQTAYLDTVQRPRRALAHWLDVVETVPAPRRDRGDAAASRSRRPWLDEREEELVVDVLRSGRLSLGPVDRPLRGARSRRRVGAPYAAAVSSGTAGLHLLCVTAGLGPGDEVITSPYSFVASANCAIYEGATPVFADVDPRTLNLDPAAVEAAITTADEGRDRAVDIFGYPCELDPICERSARGTG